MVASSHGVLGLALVSLQNAYVTQFKSVDVNYLVLLITAEVISKNLVIL